MNNWLKFLLPVVSAMRMRLALVRDVAWVRRMNRILSTCYPYSSMPLANWVRDFFAQYGNYVDVEYRCDPELCIIIVEDAWGRSIREDAVKMLEKLLGEVYESGDAGCG